MRPSSPLPLFQLFVFFYSGIRLFFVRTCRLLRIRHHTRLNVYKQSQRVGLTSSSSSSSSSTTIPFQHTIFFFHLFIQCSISLFDLSLSLASLAGLFSPIRISIFLCILSVGSGSARMNTLLVCFCRLITS